MRYYIWKTEIWTNLTCRYGMRATFQAWSQMHIELIDHIYFVQILADDRPFCNHI